MARFVARLLGLFIMFSLTGPLLWASHSHGQLLSKIEFIEDPSHEFELNPQLTSAQSSLPWETIETPEPNFGFTESAYWLRIWLIADSQNVSEKILELAFPLMDNVEFYIPTPKGYKKHITGDRFAFSTRPIKHPNFAIPLPSDLNLSNPILIKVSARDSVITPIKVWDKQSFQNNREQNHYLIGAYYGAIISIILYSLICWVVLRGSVFLLNILLVTVFCLVQLSLDGSGSMLLWGEYPEFAKRIRPFAISFLAVGSIELTKSYFQRPILIPTIPSLYSSIRVAALVGMVGAVFMPFALSIQLSMLTVIVAVVPILITGIKELTTGSLMGRYFVIGWFFLIFGGIANILRAFGILPVNLFTVYGAQFGALATMLLLTFGFTDRIRVLNRKVDQANKEMLAKEIKAKEELEEKVEQRTIDLAVSNKVVTQKNDAFKTLLETNSLMDHERSLQALLEIAVMQLAKVFPHHEMALVFNNENKSEAINPIFHDMTLDKQNLLLKLAESLTTEDSETTKKQKELLYIENKELNILPIMEEESSLLGHAFMIGKALEVSDQELIGVFVDQLNSFLKNKSLHDKLELIANRDSLTGAYSRAYFDRQFELFVEAKEEHKEEFSVLLIDVNGLKYINDHHGHGDGDHLLEKVARFLFDHVRGNDLVARLGGDEFVVLVKGGLETAEALAHKLNTLQHRLSITCGNETLPISFSLGLASSSNHPCEELLKIADELMYMNKRAFYEKGQS